MSRTSRDPNCFFSSILPPPYGQSDDDEISKSSSSSSSLYGAWLFAAASARCHSTSSEETRNALLRPWRHTEARAAAARRMRFRWRFHVTCTF